MYAIIIFLLLILFYLLYVLFTIHQHTGQVIRGLWTAEEDFCEESGIGGMIVYLREKKLYLVIYDKDQVHLEAIFPYKIYYYPQLFLREKIPATIIIEDPEGKLDEVMEPQMEVELDLRGAMTWKGNDTLYASLTKHHTI